jgi:DNA polymerase III delta prime subunit
VDLGQTGDDLAALDESLRFAEREARLQGAALGFENADALFAADALGSRRLNAVLEAAVCGRLTILFSRHGGRVNNPPEGCGVVRQELGVPDVTARARVWERCLSRGGGRGKVRAEGVDVAALASRYRLTPGQIRAAVAAAADRARRRSGPPRVTMDDLTAGCRAQSESKLGALARKIEPRAGWPDLVLPPGPLAQLREIADQVKHRHLVMGEWGFGRKLSSGRGLNALFSGPSGTGKTLAAEILAGELGLELYKIDLATVVSKYVGETEKNLDRIFAEAENANAILLFDEADALFGKRSEVRDAHDRYANIEVAYLLQRVEAYEGVTVLATNLRKNIDAAFLRRLHFAVEFPHPAEALRREIWHKCWPAGVPLAPDVDLAFLARQFDLAGGHIRNIALRGAYLAAAGARPVGMADLIRATRRELEKFGRLCVAEEFGEYRHLLEATGGP